MLIIENIKLAQHRVATKDELWELMQDEKTHVYMCGLKGPCVLGPAMSDAEIRIVVAWFWYSWRGRKGDAPGRAKAKRYGVRHGRVLRTHRGKGWKGPRLLFRTQIVV